MRSSRHLFTANLTSDFIQRRTREVIYLVKNFVDSNSLPRHPGVIGRLGKELLELRPLGERVLQLDLRLDRELRHGHEQRSLLKTIRMGDLGQDLGVPELGLDVSLEILKVKKAH